MTDQIAPQTRPAAGHALLQGLLAVLGLALLAAAGLGFSWMARSLDGVRTELAALREKTDELDARVELMRLEQSSEGRGAAAIAEQIRHYAKGLATGTAVELPRIRKGLEDAVRALATLGPDGFDATVSAYDEETDDLARAWLLTGLMQVDEMRGKQVAASTIRATAHSPTPRLRSLAARRLADFDKDYAAQVLEEVLLFSSHRGVVRHRVPPQLAEEYADITLQATQTDSFHNFISAYLSCDPENAGRTLTQVLGREEHDQVTLGACIEALGDMQHLPAVERIKELYHRPPGAFANPLFQSKCLRALGKILGKDACPFFQEELLKPQHDSLRTVLLDLSKRYCGDT
jgi:hypothetical protein